jgi:hypothetical protein
MAGAGAYFFLDWLVLFTSHATVRPAKAGAVTIATAGVVGILGLYWLWIDFIAPALGDRRKKVFERLGNVLWWASWIIAAAWIWLVWADPRMFGAENAQQVALACLFPAAIVVVIGRALKYILAG